MNDFLKKRQEAYAQKGYPCFFCENDLNNPPGNGVHIYKIKGMSVFVCDLCHHKKKALGDYFATISN